MLSKDTLIKLTNRSGGKVGYKVPDLNLKRVYQPGETKEVTMDEIRKLSYAPGGFVLLTQYFIIQNKQAIAEILNQEVEPEYFYSKDDVIKLLKEGTIDQFLDCLDFASEGVLEMVKKYAVELEVNDVRKRDAIKEKLSFDVTKAIEINKETADEGKTEAKSRRRSAPISEQKETEAEEAVKPAPRRRVSIEK